MIITLFHNFIESLLIDLNCQNKALLARTEIVIKRKGQLSTFQHPILLVH